MTSDESVWSTSPYLYSERTLKKESKKAWKLKTYQDRMGRRSKSVDPIGLVIVLLSPNPTSRIFKRAAEMSCETNDCWKDVFLKVSSQPGPLPAFDQRKLGKKVRGCASRPTASQLAEQN